MITGGAPGARVPGKRGGRKKAWRSPPDASPSEKPRLWRHPFSCLHRSNGRVCGWGETHAPFDDD
eukprot:98156-Prymnesium_polylepis.1